uniref:Uncharacterized protein n=1 Tax=viral metagenome TaxID=1070528 RepID=A0A6M3K745_9ZZZZ
MTKIYDLDGNERDASWMTGKYGSVFVQSVNEYPKFELVELRETCGPAIIKATALDTVPGDPKCQQ